jgi:hypothetical protein
VVVGYAYDDSDLKANAFMRQSEVHGARKKGTRDNLERGRRRGGAEG